MIVNVRLAEQNINVSGYCTNCIALCDLLLSLFVSESLARDERTTGQTGTSFTHLLRCTKTRYVTEKRSED